MARFVRSLAVRCLSTAFLLLPALWAQRATIGGITFSHQGLVGVGRVDAAKKDLQNETFGSLSGLSLDVHSWQRNASGTYTGTLYTQPDRGYVKSGVTTNYRPRRHKFSVTFKPDTSGSSKQDQIGLSLTETTLLVESGGTPLTSLDPTVTGSATRTGFPRLPQAFNNRLAIDAEGLALLPDGTFFVSDEYGPYLYRFSATGTLLGATRTPEALVPRRNGQDSFSSASPAAGQPNPSPLQPDAGRENSQGLEGLTVSADGRTLYALMQSATRQDGGAGGSSQRRYTRLLEYDISNPASPNLTGEWILPLPVYTVSGTQLVASVGDMVTLSRRQFLVLVRDGNGRGADEARSVYRAVLIYDTTGATNLAGTAFDSPNTPAAPNGVLSASITPATSAVLIDINDATQLSKFNLNNSSNDNSDTLAEKWESLALAPALDPAAPDDFFLFIGNDNDFSTTDGFQDGASYKSSQNIDTMVLAYRVTLPGTNTLPIFTTQPIARGVTAGQSVTFAVTAMGNPTPTYQWTKNGVPVPDATNASLTIASVGAGDAGIYAATATNSVGSTTSTTAALSINGTNSPAFTAQPLPQTVANGSTVVFSVTATNSPGYQWRRDGITLAGATSRLLVIGQAGFADAGNYTVTVSNSSGINTSNPVLLTVIDAAAADVGRLINLSIRTNITTADPLFTVGTVLGGAGTSGSKPLLVRAAGPSLTQFGIGDALSDSKLDMFAGSTVFATNDNWGGAAALSTVFSQVGAFAYTGSTSRDAAVYNAATPARDYTVQVTGVGGATGSVIAELYDATPAGTFTAATPRLVNVSVLKQIPAGSTLIAGFVIGGSTAKTVLIRVIGPRLALAPFSISGAMVDPKLDLYAGQTVVGSNDNWGGESQLTVVGNSVGAFAVTDVASRDAMLLVTLPPRDYTVQASGVNNSGGRAIVEVYEVP